MLLSLDFFQNNFSVAQIRIVSGMKIIRVVSMSVAHIY